MNIYQRLNEVRKAVSYIQKDATVKTSSTGSYPAITHDAVTAAVKKHLVDQGVIVSPTLIEGKVVDTTTTTSSGIPIIRYEGLFDIAFINCDDPTDRHVMRLESHALDQGDKAPGKAISYATKYALLKVFSIETGDSDEERIPAKGSGKPFTSKHKPTDGCWDNVPQERHEPLRVVGNSIIDFFSAGDPDGAFSFLRKQVWQDPEEKVCVWSMLDSKIRRALKTLEEAERNGGIRQH